jgi:photosystem II stability/assembly factor-like uncharacterized protein
MNCFRSRPEVFRVCPFLILLCVGITAAQPELVSAFALTPLQTSGTTWELLHSDYSEAVYRDVVFLNSTYGWVLGQENESPGSDVIVLHTSDGGDSWQLQYKDSRDYATTIDVTDQQTAWINGDEHVLYTLDGGMTWNRSHVAGSVGALSTVKFVNHTHGWTANRYVLYSTTDGGQSWQSVSGWTFDDRPKDMVVLSPLNIWACGYSGIYHSSDGCETWKQVSNMGGWSMSFVSETEAWVVSDSRLAHMTNGENWTELAVPGAFPWLSLRLMGPYLSDVQFIDKYHGWVVGTETPVMYTPDGGANWYRQSVPFMVTDTRSRVMAICCIDETHGWAVGWNGVIMRTTSADSLGARLWGGSADVLFLSAISAVVVAIVGGVFVVRRRRRRPVASTPGPNPPVPKVA